MAAITVAGKPVALGTVSVVNAETNAPATVYTTSAMSTIATTITTLSSAGESAYYVGPGSYRFVTRFASGLKALEVVASGPGLVTTLAMQTSVKADTAEAVAYANGGEFTNNTIQSLITKAVRSGSRVCPIPVGRYRLKNQSIMVPSGLKLIAPQGPVTFECVDQTVPVFTLEGSAADVLFKDVTFEFSGVTTTSHAISQASGSGTELKNLKVINGGVGSIACTKFKSSGVRVDLRDSASSGVGGNLFYISGAHPHIIDTAFDAAVVSAGTAFLYANEADSGLIQGVSFHSTVQQTTLFGVHIYDSPYAVLSGGSLYKPGTGVRVTLCDDNTVEGVTSAAADSTGLSFAGTSVNVSSCAAVAGGSDGFGVYGVAQLMMSGCKATGNVTSGCFASGVTKGIFGLVSTGNVNGLALHVSVTNARGTVYLSGNSGSQLSDDGTGNVFAGITS